MLTPTLPSPTTPGLYMFMLCYKNGVFFSIFLAFRRLLSYTSQEGLRGNKSGMLYHQTLPIVLTDGHFSTIMLCILALLALPVTALQQK